MPTEELRKVLDRIERLKPVWRISVSQLQMRGSWHGSQMGYETRLEFCSPDGVSVVINNYVYGPGGVWHCEVKVEQVNEDGTPAVEIYHQEFPEYIEYSRNADWEYLKAYVDQLAAPLRHAQDAERVSDEKRKQEIRDRFFNG